MDLVFDKIILNDFLSIGHAEIALTDKGFVLVKGINKEGSIEQSNGSGKSSIFDAIFFALTGSTVRGADNVINEKSIEKNCYCDLQFHSQDKTYRIVRYKGKNNHCEFYIDDELVSDQIKKTQEMLEKTIPVVSSPEVLGSIIILGQGLPYKFSSFSPSKRKDMLETMSGASAEIDHMKYKLDKEEASHSSIFGEEQTKIIKNNGIIDGLSSSISFLNESLTKEQTLSDSHKTQEDINSEISKLNEEILVLNSNNASNEKALEDSNNELARLLEQKSQYETTLAAIKQQLISIKSGNCPTCGRPYEINEETLKNKEIFENKVISFKACIDDIVKKISEINETISRIRYEITQNNNKTSSLQIQINKLEEEIKNTNNIESRIKEIQDKLSETTSQINILKVQNNESQKISDKEQEIVDCIHYIKRLLSREFRGYMQEEIIKFISSRAEYYSKYLFTNGSVVTIELSGNKIDIKLGNRMYENLSGGERQRVDLIVQFSLKDVLVITSGFSCNLLVLDEAFDNLDAQGSESLIKLLVSEFNDIDSVFIVTHHSEIDIPYDEEITIIKEKDGISYMR